MLSDATLEKLAAITADPTLDELGREINAMAPGAARLARARTLFARLVSEAPRLLALSLADILSSAATPTAKTRLASVALRAAPKDQGAALAILRSLEEIHPGSKADARHGAALIELIETANEAGRGDLTRALGVTLRKALTAPEDSVAANVLSRARLANIQTRIGLWRTGRMLELDSQTGGARRAQALYSERYPYHRDEADPSRICGRALVLNGRAFLKARTLAGAHNHSNLTQSYVALNRDAPLAIDVLLLRDLDFEAIRERIAPPDVILNNFGNAEAIAAHGFEAKIRMIADHFGAPLINDPEPMKATTRDANWRRIGEREHIWYPKTIRLDESLSAEEATNRVAEEFDGQVILRDLTGHMGSAMHLVPAKAEGEVKAALHSLGFGESDAGDEPNAGGGAYAIAFHDFRDEDGLYRKHRLYRVQGDLVGVHRFTAGEWNVHRKAMKALDAEDPSRRFEDQSIEFAKDLEAYVPRPVLDELDAALSEVGMDAVGVDFAMMPDGRAFIFEMNAAMRVTGREQIALDRIGRMLEETAIAHRAERGAG